MSVLSTSSSRPLTVTLIVAHDSSRGIGSNGKLPWKLSKEMRYFAQATTAAPPGLHNAVVMGRTTWEGIPKKFRPLKDRLNVVLSGRSREELQLPNTVHQSSSLADAMRTLSKQEKLHRVYIIGGAQLYDASIAGSDAGYADSILLTRILKGDNAWTCDTFFPEVDSALWRKADYAEHTEWLEGVDVPSDLVHEGEVAWQYELWIKKRAAT